MADLRKTTRVGNRVENEEGYSADSETDTPVPPGGPSTQDMDDLLSSIRTRGLDVVEEEPQLPSALERRLVRDSDEIDMSPAPSAPDGANDPVRVYLREMGASPLLTREGEVEIAKRIERGQLSAMKALSRSPIVVHQVLAVGEDLKRGVRSIKTTVVSDEDEITEEMLQDRIKEIPRRIDQIHKNYKTACRLAEQLVI